MNPDIQERLQEEIDEAFRAAQTKDGFPDYSALVGLEYLGCNSIDVWN